MSSARCHWMIMDSFKIQKAGLMTIKENTGEGSNLCESGAEEEEVDSIR